MESLRAKIGLVVGLMGLVLAGQGCVPWSKFIKIKKENDRLQADLSEKDRILGDEASRLQALRDQLNAANQLIELFKKQGAEANLLAKNAQEALNAMQSRLEKFAGEHPGVGSAQGRLLLYDKLLFPLGSDDVSEQGKKVLADLAKEFRGDKEFTLQIDGHTDDHRVVRPTVRRFIDNWGLSAARALAVTRILAKNGIAETNMQAAEYSMWRPRLPNTNEDSRAKNRRVEIIFLPTKPLAPAVTPIDTPAGEAEKPPAAEPPKPETPKAEPAKAPTPPATPPAEPKKE